MKTFKTIAALALLVGACFAAYYSYSSAFKPAPMHSLGPPPGISMPKMEGPPKKTASPASSSKTPPSKGQAGNK